MKDNTIYDVMGEQIGDKFLNEVCGATNNQNFSKFVRTLGYKRDRAIELLHRPQNMKLKEVVKIADKYGFNVEIIVTKAKDE